MNKEINEFDRIIIGVREWAVGETLRQGHFVGQGVDTATDYALKLEEYVLRGIKEDKGFMPDKTHLPDWRDKS